MHRTGATDVGLLFKIHLKLSVTADIKQQKSEPRLNTDTTILLNTQKYLAGYYCKLKSRQNTLLSTVLQLLLFTP